MVDPTGRLESVCQSKRCVWNEPDYREVSTVTFDPQRDLYARGREQKLTFNVYMCQPAKHPYDSYYNY